MSSLLQFCFIVILIFPFFWEKIDLEFCFCIESVKSEEKKQKRRIKEEERIIKQKESCFLRIVLEEKFNKMELWLDEYGEKDTLLRDLKKWSTRENE